MAQMIKVGVFATICILILAVLVWKIEDINPFHKQGKHLGAVFPTVAGLDDKAAVRMAGVRIGRVDGIGLAGDGRSAQLRLLIEQPVPSKAISATWSPSNRSERSIWSPQSGLSAWTRASAGSSRPRWRGWR